MKVWLGLAALSVALCAFAQAGAQGGPQEGAPKPLKPSGTPRTLKSDTRPVTQAEAAAVFRESRKILSTAIEQKIPGEVAIPSGSSPVTREQVVAEFTKELAGLSPQFKFTTRPVTFDASVVKIAAPQRSSLLHLIKMGFVGKVAPLATGPKDSLTPYEFGDALGFFQSRIAQLTHMPDPKWSPLLGAGS